MKVQILIDNPSSWIIPFAEKLIQVIKTDLGINVKLLNNHADVESGEILIMLSCEKIFKKLELNKYNLVVHESKLPHGKGWSPLTWQVLEGKSEIPVTLFQAVETVDAGDIYDTKYFQLNGSELINELREMQVKATKELILNFLKKYPNVKFTTQIGKESFYRKRSPRDSALDINKTILEQFNNLRVCDNERYPAYFIKDGIKYIIRIEKA